MSEYRNFNPAADTIQEKLLTSKVFSAKIAFARKRKTAYGGIAQLGERLNGIQEVSGSIPLISTKTKGQTEVCFFVLVGVLPVGRLREAECGAFRSGIAAEHDRREYPAALHQQTILKRAVGILHGIFDQIVDKTAFKIYFIRKKLNKYYCNRSSIEDQNIERTRKHEKAL